MNNEESNHNVLHTNLTISFQFANNSSFFILTMSRHSEDWTFLYLILTMLGWLCLAEAEEEKVIFSRDYSKQDIPPTEDGNP